MRTLYDIKPAFQGFLRPLVARLARWGVSANQVTIAAVLLSGCGGLTLALWPIAPWALLLIPGVLFLRMALNAIDGMLAREHGMSSSLGAILNELGDVLSDAVLYMPLALVPEISTAWVAGFVWLSTLSEMTGVVAVQVGGSRRYDGPLGKSDRAFLFGAVCLGLGLGWLSAAWINGLFVIACGLIVITIFNRCRSALKELAA